MSNEEDESALINGSVVLQADTDLEIKWFGVCDYRSVWLAMKTRVQQMLADPNLADQLWCLHHHPVYTLGTRGLRAGLLREVGIPIVHADRGGDVTYHGPGQLVMYPLINLHPLSLSGAGFVHELERLILQQLEAWGITGAQADPNRPGIYVDGYKLASLGLRCKRAGVRQVSYHGIALNVAMDLAPFLDIHPCGYAGQRMTQVSTLVQQQRLQPPFEALSAAQPDPNTSVAQATEIVAKRFLHWYQQRKLRQGS
ncbi:MAG: lipoyl(octanoyl) transferase LipB [Gammaproteobacteria bacterium]